MGARVSEWAQLDNTVLDGIDCSYFTLFVFYINNTMPVPVDKHIQYCNVSGERGSLFDMGPCSFDLVRFDWSSTGKGKLLMSPDYARQKKCTKKKKKNT